MAKNMLLRAKILKVNQRFHAGIDAHRSSRPLQFFTKNNLCIQNAKVGVSPCVQLTFLDYFL